MRCVPYSVDAGVQTLLLHEGRYYLEHQLNEFRALGHYVVRGDRIVLFNDVNCSKTRGRYAWNLEHRRLSFEVIDDPCPYVDERSNDLTLEPWSRIDACHSGIKDWYPVRVGWLGVYQSSGSSFSAFSSRARRLIQRFASALFLARP